MFTLQYPLHTGSKCSCRWTLSFIHRVIDFGRTLLQRSQKAHWAESHSRPTVAELRWRRGLKYGQLIRNRKLHNVAIPIGVLQNGGQTLHAYQGQTDDRRGNIQIHFIGICTKYIHTVYILYMSGLENILTRDASHCCPSAVIGYLTHLHSIDIICTLKKLSYLFPL